jgi:hypothetical protein
VKTAVDRLYEEATEVAALLAAAGNPSLLNVVTDHFRKALLLAAASQFERQVCECVLVFVQERSAGCVLTRSFVHNRAVNRQYHTWFSWSDTNANNFFAMFGPEFKAAMVAKVGQSESLKESVRSFLELGNERNKLVHQDYATFQLNKTLDEVYLLYSRSQEFVDGIGAFLRTALEDAKESSA